MEQVKLSVVMKLVAYLFFSLVMCCYNMLALYLLHPDQAMIR